MYQAKSRAQRAGSLKTSGCESQPSTREARESSERDKPPGRRPRHCDDGLNRVVWDTQSVEERLGTGAGRGEELPFFSPITKLGPQGRDSGTRHTKPRPSAHPSTCAKLTVVLLELY